MAVQIEFLNLIIPISKINEFYPGGIEAYKYDNKNYIGRRIIFDDFIVRDGAMDPLSPKKITKEWMELGLEPTTGEGDDMKFKDLCIVECSLISHSTLPCDWLSVDEYFVSHVDDKSERVIKYNRI